MLILNIESSTEICSVALARNGEVLALAENEERNAHSRVLTLLVERVMDEANHALTDLDAVAISTGPGSYTSLRVGASVAKGICFALNKPLVPVDTLRSLAEAARAERPDGGYFIPMIDARRMEVYCAVHNSMGQEIKGKHAKVIDETSFGTFFASNLPLIFAGNGADKCRAVLTNPRAHFLPLRCSARHLAPLSQTDFRAGRTVDPAYFVPSYVKQPFITTPKRRSLR